MKIIFLDCDGVINSCAFHTKQHEAGLCAECECRHEPVAGYLNAAGECSCARIGGPWIQPREHEFQPRGFLRPRGWPQEHIDPAAIAVLNKIVEQTGAFVVVSSTWRIGVRRTEVNGWLRGAGFTGIVLALTPVLGKRRGFEIQAWLDAYNKAPLRRHGEVTHFVILDDDSDMEHLMPKLVQIDNSVGLTEADIPRIVAQLES
jgi:hypothetical protein